MSSLGKKFVLVTICVSVVLSVLLVESAVAPVSMPANPSSAPEIVSVDIFHKPVWCPPVYTTNPYTGEVTVTSPGYWIPIGTIEITIKNRPFTSYTDKNGNYINVYYTFFMRMPYLGIPWDTINRPSYVVYQSNSDYTVFTLKYSNSFDKGPDLLNAGGQEGAVFDFRVQAVTGYFQGKYPFLDAVFEGEGSEWTEFTITIPTSDKPGTSTAKPTSTSNSNNTPPPQQNPLLSTLFVVVIVSVCIILVLVVVIVVLVFSRQRRHKHGHKFVVDSGGGCGENG